MEIYFSFLINLDAIQQFPVIIEMWWPKWDSIYQIFVEMVAFERLKQYEKLSRKWQI